MFDVGFQELLLIGVVALLVVGPERLPRLARTTGLWIGKVRRMVSQVKEDVERELHVEDLKRMVDDPAQLNDLYGAVDGLKKDVDGAMSDFSDDLIDPLAVDSDRPADPEPGDESVAGTNDLPVESPTDGESRT